MSIQIYNSLTKKKEDFVPLNPPRVNIYSCGVTVYDDCHIGHARSLYIFEVIRRYLKYRGFQVNFARNITDIDDKIINRAKELKIDWKELVDKYIERYDQDLSALGLDKADSEPRATENIPEMLKFIQGLIDKGYAYATFTGVYFSVRKFKGYGKLSGQSIEQMLTGVRKDADETKEDPLDFALWKKSKPGEPFWPSPWGEGRPGWHIECSVMSAKYLNTETLDIHAGGRDLIFPHHENEIAQAEALTGKLFAKYWIHHGLLAINSQKMSKSLGNFVTIKGFLEKHKYPEILKLFFLNAHYSHPVDYTEEKIKEAKTALERVHILLRKISAAQLPVASPQLPVPSARSPVSQSSRKEIGEIRNRFIEAMDDDFNTPQGLARIFDLVRLMNNRIEDADFVLEARDVLFELTNIFALDLTKTQSQTITSDVMFVIPNSEVEELIKKRNEAKKKKDFKEADEIRKDLEAQGIILEDTKDGTTWRRKL